MSKVSELLDRAINNFLEKTPLFQAHMDDKQNPHEVDKGQVGLGNLIDSRQATKIELDAHKQAATLQHPDGSVTTAKIADGAVKKDKIEDGAVTIGKIATGAVNFSKLADSSVTADKILTNAVTETKIKDGAVTTAKIGEGAVNFTRLAAVSVTDEKIYPGAVTTVKLADGAVTAAKIADNAVSDNAIGSRTVDNPKDEIGIVQAKLTVLFNHFAGSIRTLRGRVADHVSGDAERHDAEAVDYDGEDTVKDKIDGIDQALDDHVSGTDGRHSADDVDYDGNLTVKGKIDNLILTEMGGIPDHTHTGESPDVSRVSYNDLEDLPDLPAPTPGGATIKIAAANATERSKLHADYICEGVDDDLEINAAIQALDGLGGCIELSEGDFAIGATIDIDINNIWLKGQGAATKIRLNGGDVPPELDLMVVVSANVSAKLSDFEVVPSTYYHGDAIGNRGYAVITGCVCEEMVGFANYKEAYLIGNKFSGDITNNSGDKLMLIGNKINYLYQMNPQAVLLPATAAGIADVNDIDISNIIITE